MIKLSSGSKYSHKYSLEMIGEIDLQKKLKLPRHISSIESGSYNHSNWSKPQTLSACPLESQSPTSNAAWNILKYQLSDRPSQQKHLANLQSNLEHRLSVARVQGNERLVQILQEEFQQLQNS